MTFGHEEALQLGQTIIDLEKEDGVNVAVHIEKNRIPVFTYLMEGTPEENYMWLFRKKRVTDHYQLSSHFIAKHFEESGLSHDTDSLLPARNASDPRERCRDDWYGVSRRLNTGD